MKKIDSYRLILCWKSCVLLECDDPFNNLKNHHLINNGDFSFVGPQSTKQTISISLDTQRDPPRVALDYISISCLGKIPPCIPRVIMYMSVIKGSCP